MAHFQIQAKDLYEVKGRGGSKIHDFFGGAGETQKKSTVEKKIVFRFTRENYIVFGHFLKLGVFEQKIDLKKFCVPKSL